MAGVFDVQAMILLPAEWAELVGDAALYRTCFEGKLANALIETWRTLLVSTGVHFVMAYSPDLANKVQVVLELRDESVGEQYCGDDSGNDDDTAALDLQETLVMNVMATSPELLRAIYKPLRACMVRAIPKFVGEGLDGLIYRGGGELGPEQGVLPEGIYARRQTWAVLASDKVPLATPDQTPKSLLVAASDVTVNGHAGGVTPEES